ncbi:hypothetical protein CKM354_000016500 [Cercospora kikuchii]|uniref:Zn(2)-C6 fungal-type domain-containing protein n=1 Tax=Cercospora kikuchii TaxID=84275 RepID=A0A9P3C8F7_9PEZI|nr:uncharacterized protein CKM354_000016500 [Cercospora kikuchii]GIZ36697.1 hypothetical protein CKM354_000016500 [Cercospora kikuchii]
MPRPYRSHKIPACDACRRRKVRCEVDDDSATCKRCRRLSRACLFLPPNASSTGEEDEINESAPPRVRQRRRYLPQNATAHPDATPSASSSTAGHVAGDVPTAKTAMLVGPAVAEDVRILEDFLDAHGLQENYLNGSGNDVGAGPPRPRHGRVTAYNTVFSSNGSEEAMVYVTVPPGHAGLELARHPGKTQLAAMQQLLDISTRDELVSLYSRFVHPHFPIVDMHAVRSNADSVTSTLLCYIYMLALPLWHKSPLLAGRQPPNFGRVVNLATAALQSDFLVPTTSTITAAVLDLLGRPVRTVTTNILTTGKMVALAHSMGLHRDSSRWSASQEEKSLRKRLWWSVVIHDCWGSYAHGTPPIISSDRYDVVVLDPADWAPVHDDLRASLMAVQNTQFCYLTRHLSDLLELVHGLKTRWEEVPRTLRKIECALDDWEADLRRLCSIDLRKGPPSGHSSMQFCFLSVRLLVQRLYLRAATAQTAYPIDTEKQYRIMSLRESAITIVDYVNMLTPEHFSEFWFAHSSHFLVSTIIMLLRCMIESHDPDQLSRCTSKLIQFRQTLQDARANYGWDIADMCLERCSDAIERVTRSSAYGPPFNDHQSLNTGATEMPPPPLPDFDILDADWLAHSASGLDTLLPTQSLDLVWDRQ